MVKRSRRGEIVSFLHSGQDGHSVFIGRVLASAQYTCQSVRGNQVLDKRWKGDPEEGGKKKTSIIPNNNLASIQSNGKIEQWTRLGSLYRNDQGCLLFHLRQNGTSKATLLAPFLYRHERLD
ncbi:hypothetical protein TNCT_128341 [Trichonephila clavata]|uniref:Uncharacterized protein n=1 Tax=Trichonephila clavata TaxID=2740835 RepID=A0A8X6LCT5_TRICU|nr:hypothetical protein TNCT_128341 [Trichonephila clavata]